MKKLIPLFVIVFSTNALCQLPVSTLPSLKNALIEEFTGINCVYCPDGHKIAAQIVATNPNRAYAVNIHTGGFATPNSNQPDFRTQDGNAIAAIPNMGITGYPQGAVNRAYYPTTATALAMSRGSWSSAVSAQLNQPAYANIAGQATLNVSTKLLTVNMQVYYTSNSPAPINKLTVMLLQNNINGPQTGGAQFNPTMVNPDGTYRHMKALRDVLTTGATGQDISPTTQGSLISQTINYTVPAIIGTVPVDLSNLEIIAFVAEGVSSIVNVAKVPITYTGFTTTNNASVFSIPAIEELCQNTIAPVFEMKNNGSAPITSAQIRYSINNGAPVIYNYSGSLAPLSFTTISLPSLTYALSTTNNLNIQILSVNGLNDDDPSDNSGNRAFNATNSSSPTLNLTLNITQDRYGDEITWKIFNSNGVQLASGGPYTQLSANGTFLNTHPIVMPSGGCYRLVVYDSYGDGINSGYGSGNISLLDGNGNQIYFNNGQYTSFASRYFSVNGCAISPTITAVNDTICSQSQTTLNASGGVFFAWSTGSADSTIMVGPGTYTVTVTNTNGCTGTATKTVFAAPLSKPTGLIASSIKSASVKIKWTKAACAAGYKIRIRQVGTTTWRNISVGDTSEKFVFNLVPSTNYEYQMASASGTIISAYTASRTFTTPCACILPVFNVGTITSASAQLNWADDACGVKYTIQYRRQGFSTWTSRTMGDTVSTYTLTGLQASQTYEYRTRRECNTSGSVNSGWTSISTFTTLPLRIGETPESENVKLLRAVDVLGREVDPESKGLIILQFTDGTTKKIFRRE